MSGARGTHADLEYANPAPKHFSTRLNPKLSHVVAKNLLGVAACEAMRTL